MRYGLTTVFLIACTAPSLWAKTDTSIYKQNTNIYKTQPHVYKSPTSMPTGNVTCKDIASQQWHLALEVTPYCNLAFRACIAYEMLQKQLKSPIFRSRPVNQSDLAYARNIMRYALISCQLAIDSINAGYGNFPEFTGLR